MPSMVQPVISDAFRNFISGVFPTASTKPSRIFINFAFLNRGLHGRFALFSTLVTFGQGRPLSESASKLLSVQGQPLHTDDGYRTVDLARRNFSQRFVGGFAKDVDIFAFFCDAMKSANADCGDPAPIQCDVFGTSAGAGIKIENFFNIRHDATGFLFGYANGHFSSGLAWLDDSSDDFNGPRIFVAGRV